VISQADEHIAKESYFVSLEYLSPFNTASTWCPPILSICRVKTVVPASGYTLLILLSFFSVTSCPVWGKGDLNGARF
jgi:hypothetical protein